MRAAGTRLAKCARKLHFRFAPLVRVNPLASAVEVNSQERLHAAAVRLTRPQSQSPHLGDGFILFEELHVATFAALVLLSQFAPQENSRKSSGAKRLTLAPIFVFSTHYILRIMSLARSLQYLRSV
jgi:hypothetical protein